MALGAASPTRGFVQLIATAAADRLRSAKREFVWSTVAVAALLIALLRMVHFVATFRSLEASVGIDSRTYLEATTSWLAGDVARCSGAR
jgi:hypothetical protein